jgi:hypothetical protein
MGIFLGVVGVIGFFGIIFWVMSFDADKEEN